jgi:dihydrofolate reductase
MEGTMDSLSIIVAMTYNRVIGRRGKIPWHIPDEQKLFRHLTEGNTVLMGRKTYESIGQPLKNRNNIVVSSTLPAREGITVARSLEEALDKAQHFGKPIFSIGGAKLYEETLPLAGCLLISYIKQDYAGDTYFPEFEPRDYIIKDYRNYPNFEFMRYQKRI